MNGLAALVGAMMIANEPPALPGAVLPYDEAVRAAQDQGKPLVTFYGVEARPVPGLVAAFVPEGRQLPGVPKPSVTVSAFGKGISTSFLWPHDVSDLAIAEKAASLEDSLKPRQMIVPPDVQRWLQSQNCKTG